MVVGVDCPPLRVAHAAARLKHLEVAIAVEVTDHRRRPVVGAGGGAGEAALGSWVLVEVYELRPADLLEVRGPERTYHIPFLRSIIRDVDVASGRLVVDPPAGLLDL